jgi:hypothetical protein
MYIIKDYSFNKAKLLGVTIKPSIKKGKKIDVYKNNDYVTSIGAINYNDYPTYIEKKGIDYANQRRILYHQRHKKDLNKINSAGYYAYNILW